MSQDDILHQQQTYYSARAQEYDESILQTGRYAALPTKDKQVQQEEQKIVRAIHALGHQQDVLELACGTGLWTKELLPIARKITAFDGSLEMMGINRQNVNDSRIDYHQADLFKWHPTHQYDLVFFAFWLSHIPPDKLSTFFDSVTQAVQPNGRIFIVDEPAGGRQLSGPTDGIYQTRKLHDGREFKIVKIYYEPAEVGEWLRQRGFRQIEIFKGDYVFYLTATFEAHHE